jgi:hypothetical protein
MITLSGRHTDAAALKRVRDALPAAVRARVDANTREVPDGRWRHRPETIGWYQGGLIELRAGTSAADRLAVFVHEVGHAWYEQVFPPAQILAWRAFWSGNLKQMPTAYARRNAYEGWAECFGHAYRRGLRSRLNRRVLAWVRQAVEDAAQ